MEDTTIEDVLKTFDNFYAKKDYANALLTLQNNENKISPELLNYNLSTVYAQTGSWPLARFHLLNAQALGFSGEQVWQNLKVVESKLDIEKLEKPLTVTDFMVRAGLFASGGPLTSIGLLMLLLGLLLIKKAPTIRKTLQVALLVSFPVGMDLWIRSWPRAIVIESQSIMEGPSAIFKGSGEVVPGILIIGPKTGNWRRVIYPSRFSGWIMNKGLKELE